MTRKELSVSEFAQPAFSENKSPKEVGADPPKFLDAWGVSDGGVFESQVKGLRAPDSSTDFLNLRKTNDLWRMGGYNSTEPYKENIAVLVSPGERPAEKI